MSECLFHKRDGGAIPEAASLPEIRLPRGGSDFRQEEERREIRSLVMKILKMR